MDWRREIIDLHRFFEAYFLGQVDSIERAASVFAPEFTFVGPHGQETNRQATLDQIQAGHAHTTSVTITTSGHRLLHATDDLVIATYVEHHQLAASSNQRLSTVVFAVDPDTPNGVAWLRVHETWMDQETDSDSGG